MIKPIEYKWVKLGLSENGEEATKRLNDLLEEGWSVQSTVPADFFEEGAVDVWVLLVKQENVEEEVPVVLGPKGYCGQCGESVMIGSLHQNRNKTAIRLQGACKSCGRIEFYESMPRNGEQREEFEIRMKDEILEMFRAERKNKDRMAASKKR